MSMGRPATDIDEQQLDAMAAALREGATNGGVAALFGVTRRTFQRWLAEGEQDAADGREATPHARLWQTYIAARGEALRDASRRTFQERPLEWLRLGPGREEWTEHVAIDAAVQVEGKQRVLVDVKAPWDLLNDPQWAESAKAAYAWLKENDLLLVDDDDDEDATQPAV